MPRYPGLYFKKVNGVFERHANLRLKALGLTRAQSDILRYLYERGDTPTTQKDIEQHLQLTHPTVIGLLRRLEEKGFVCITVDAHDRRCRLVRLTAAHGRVHAEMESMRLALEARLLKGFTPEEIDTLLALLDRAWKNLESE